MTTESRINQNVVWTRGKGCMELAEVLAEGTVERIQGDLVSGCISHRADFVVSKKMLGDFDTANVAVPVDFEPENINSVSATVAGGPHSELAARTADRIAQVLGVPLEIVSAHQSAQDIASAMEVVAEYGTRYATAERRVVQAQDMNELADSIDEGSLLVVGAPGGEWLRRNRFGRGARLKGTTKGGAVMVRSAPDRVYRFMGDPVYVAPLLQASDTIRLHPQEVLAVADEGMLVGVVRREILGQVGNDTVASVMEEPVSTRVDETLEEARPLTETFGTDPIPVTDHEEHLVGGLSLPAA
jgi:CBS domain-containing protein